MTVVLQLSGFADPGTDEYYPAEEAAERSSIVWPRLVGLHAGGAVLEWPDKSSKVLGVGDRYREWELVAVISQAASLAVLEQDFPHWGMLAYIGKKGPVATILKAIGQLKNLPTAKAFPPQYFDPILSAQEDVLGREILGQGNEPDYETVAGLLPPLRTYTFLGTATSSQKIIVWPDGRLGLGVHHRQLDQVLFDPASNLQESAGTVATTKQGLIGQYLPVTDYAFSNAGANSSWEEIAFATGQEKLETYVCLRTGEAKRAYWRLPGQQPIKDGAAFYRALLSVQQEWEMFLAKGTQLEVPDPRVSDSSKAAIVRALISEVGNHPKYGVGVYGGKGTRHFPANDHPAQSVPPGLGIHRGGQGAIELLPLALHQARWELRLLWSGDFRVRPNADVGSRVRPNHWGYGLVAGMPATIAADSRFPVGSDKRELETLPAQFS
jgi:hypothetical protein